MTRFDVNATKINVIRKYRMNKGLSWRGVEKLAHIAYQSVLRLERGEPVFRLTAAKYFAALDLDLNDSETWPAGLNIIDAGDRIIVSSSQ